MSKIIETNYSDEMKQSYIDYAMSVIVSRALPDVRDGLKPVHRRILYAMDDLDIKHNNPHKKSARIVGDVLGKYHPHGDCLRGDTLVFLANGEIRTIKELYEIGKPHAILAYDPDTKSIVEAIADHFRIGQYTNKIYHLKLNNGYVLSVTDNHPVLNVHGEYIEAKDLNVGDKLYTNIITTQNEELKAIDHVIKELSLREDKINKQITKMKKQAYRVSDIEDYENKNNLSELRRVILEFKNRKERLVTISPTKYVEAFGGHHYQDLEIKEINIEDVDQEPMYDFTVMGLENMILPMRMSDNGCIEVMCVHNSSVYDAMVRLSQDFKTNHPLVDGQGNFGSIDGDGAAAMRYCLTGDSLVSTNKGLIEIKDLIEYTNNKVDKENNDFTFNEEIIVDSLKGSNKTSKLFNSGKHDVIKIKTNYGFQLTGSYNHPILVFNKKNKSDKFLWKTLDEIVVGDIVYLSVNSDFKYSKDEVLFTQELMKNAIIDKKYDMEGLILKLDNQKDTEKMQVYLLKFGVLAIQSKEVKCELFIPLELFNNLKSIFDYELCSKNLKLRNNIISRYNLSQYEHDKFLKNNLILAEEILSHTDLNMNNSFNVIGNAISGEYILDVITSVEKLPEKETVYSVKVDSDCHSFVANGFINHNTEARLTPLADEMLRGLKSNTVDFGSNFDQSLKEPLVLPSGFCNLLVNGSEGIAVGMATNIPPHNLNEVNNACKAYLKNKNITSRGLTRYIKGPDFPTGGLISNKSDLKEIYESGTGTVRVRATMEVEKLSGGRHNIVVTEIPYSFAGNKSRLIDSLIDLVQNKKLNEVADVRDESSKDGIRIVLETKRGVDPEKLKHKLYSTTKLEDTIKMNLLAIVDGKPKVLSLKEIIENYMEFLIDIYLRSINFKLSNLRHDQEIHEGLIKASDSIDLIIDIIRGSKNIKDAKKALMSEDVSGVKFKTKKAKKEAMKLNFTDKQADAILRMQLQRLVGLEINKLKDELKDINQQIKECLTLINNEDKLYDLIILDMDKIKDKHGRYRRTKLDDIEKAEYVEEEVIEDLYLLIDRFNYVKVIDSNSYARANVDDYDVCKVKSNDSVHLFTDTDHVIQLKMQDMKINKMSDRGYPLENKMNIFCFGSQEDLKDKNILFITKLGYVKQVKFEEFITNRKKIKQTRLRKNDEIVKIIILDEDDAEVVLRTKDNREIRFDLNEVSIQGRNASGVTGINLNKNDFVIEGKVEKATNFEKKKRGSKGYIVE